MPTVRSSGWFVSCPPKCPASSVSSYSPGTPWNNRNNGRCLDGGEYAADLAIDIANVPVTVSGTLRLEPMEDGCVNHVRLKIDCGIPFIGKTLAEFVTTDCKRLIADEYEYIRDRLDSDA